MKAILETRPHRGQGAVGQTFLSVWTIEGVGSLLRNSILHNGQTCSAKDSRPLFLGLVDRHHPASAHNPASRVSASPNRSCFTPIRSMIDRYRLHSLRFSSPFST